MGVPTVGGEVGFHPAYDGNILVNAMTVGVADQDKIFLSAAAGVGNPVVYVGSKTGRDGIHGATMASAEFGEDSEEKRPTVQVGDPFTEKLLIEACLELMASDAIVAIQDMGAAGLTSSSIEMASKGGVGLELDMDAVPCREEGMTPYEMMLSESQERMLMVLKPGREDMARDVFEKWELDFAVIGRVTDTGRMVLTWRGETVCDLPIGPLADDAPKYDRPYVRTSPPEPLTDVPESTDIGADLLKLMASPDLCSRRWVWEQYDRQVGGDTVQTGGDAAVVRIHGTDKALAITTDCTPRYCYADPYEGGKQAIAEAYRNLCAVGATPLAATDCLNFGNPERPEIMAQLVGCIEGMAEACRVLGLPIVSGNVSLYNETKGADGSANAVLPTPAIGAVGLLADWRKAATIGFKAEGNQIILLGGTCEPSLGQSLWCREILGREAGAPPVVDLKGELETGAAVRELINRGLVLSVHDVSDGGLLVALAEMALAGGIGCKFNPEWSEGDLPEHATEGYSRGDWLAYLFGEEQGCYLVEVAGTEGTSSETSQLLTNTSVDTVGVTGGDSIRSLEFSFDVPLADLRAAHEGTLPRRMEGEIIA